MYGSSSFLRWLLTGTALLSSVAACQSLPVQTDSVGNVPHRLLVVYRNGSIPGGAEQSAARAGARLLRRHERFGTAVVTASAVAEAQLRADPDVEYVVQDRAIPASRLQTQALFSTAPAAGRTAPTLRANVPRLFIPFDIADTFYTASPQGWAVRAVGGFGGGVADSVTTGPWATTTGVGVRIAILDSGVDRNHPDIAPNLAFNLSKSTGKHSPVRAMTVRRRTRAATVRGLRH